VFGYAPRRLRPPPPIQSSSSEPEAGFQPMLPVIRRVSSTYTIVVSVTTNMFILNVLATPEVKPNLDGLERHDPFST